MNDVKSVNMFREYRKKLLEQLAIDYNCASSDFLAKENIITSPAWNAGRRSYIPDIFLQMATCGGNAVIMADERMHEFLREWSKDTEPCPVRPILTLKMLLLRAGLNLHG
ncbi:MAG: hypothetical protein K5929_10285 [Lachnospiraceae bacterium]|nr:hypothetical protein [Lachnospiraceae bacterium]